MNFSSKAKEEIIYENSSFSNKSGINPGKKVNLEKHYSKNISQRKVELSKFLSLGS